MFVSSSFAGDWRSNYTNDLGTPCCGENDCFIVPKEKVTFGVCGYMVDGECIPRDEIKPSEDDKYYHCPTYRCFFVPGGLS